MIQRCHTFDFLLGNAERLFLFYYRRLFLFSVPTRRRKRKGKKKKKRDEEERECLFKVLAHYRHGRVPNGLHSLYRPDSLAPKELLVMANVGAFHK